MRNITATFLLAIALAGAVGAQESEPEFTRDYMEIGRASCRERV